MICYEYDIIDVIMKINNDIRVIYSNMIAAIERYEYILQAYKRRLHTIHASHFELAFIRKIICLLM
jgi:hypothetical protein